MLGLLLSLLFGFFPMLFYAWVLYWLDRYEKEPKSLLGGVYLWGAIVAAGGAFLINTILGIGVYLFTGSEAATNLTTGTLIAPLVEESLKGLAVLLVFLVFRSEFDSILDGIIYAGVTALGFAATENVYYIYEYGYVQSGLMGLAWLVFVRTVLVGWQHPFYTAFTGIGLAMARMSRRTWTRLAAPLAGWSVAVFTHSIHNTLAEVLSGTSGLVFGTLVDWSGWAFMVVVIWWSIRTEQAAIKDLLREEVSLGLITTVQYRTVTSTWAQTIARMNGLTSGRFMMTTRFYQLCAELAHKKRQRRALGEEGNNSTHIEQLRKELAALSPQVPG